MTDERVSVTLYFKTDRPPSLVAMEVGRIVVQGVADPMDSIHWSTLDLDQDDTQED